MYAAIKHIYHGHGGNSVSSTRINFRDCDDSLDIQCSFAAVSMLAMLSRISCAVHNLGRHQASCCRAGKAAAAQTTSMRL